MQPPVIRPAIPGRLTEMDLFDALPPEVRAFVRESKIGFTTKNAYDLYRHYSDWLRVMAHLQALIDREIQRARLA